MEGVGVLFIIVAAVIVLKLIVGWMRFEENPPWPTLLEIWKEGLVGSGRYAWIKDLTAEEKILREGRFIDFGEYYDDYPDSKWNHGLTSHLNITEKGREKLLELLSEGIFSEEDINRDVIMKRVMYIRFPSGNIKKGTVSAVDFLRNYPIRDKDRRGSHELEERQARGIYGSMV